MSDQLKLDLDPKKILQSIKDISENVKQLSDVVEESLGKQAPKNIDAMEKQAEKSAGAISSHFKNLSTRIKEDLKTAFNISGLAAGFKLGETLGQGIKEVFNLERAFDRLNTRLGLTGKQFQDFKKNVGTAVASTGQKLEDIFPGIETASAKGNVKSPQELAVIGKSLGEVKAATGENTEALADAVIEILRTQGKKINAQNFTQTLDTLQGTRTAGAFKTAGEAGQAIEGITKGVSPEQLKKMGLGTRELGGLAAQASKAGEGGQDILQHILQMATQAGGKQLLNSVFGTQLFKGDKLDVNAFQKVNKQQFGKYSEQVLSSATGADQAGLSRFLDVMKSGQNDYKKVVQGSNETAVQFKTATNNLASSVDQFKEKAKNATRMVGEDLAAAANELMKGNFKGAYEAAQHGGKALMENKGTIGTALGASAAAAVLLGGGANNLLKKLPGMGGIAAGVTEGQALQKAAGVQPVYVVNANEISSGKGGILDTVKGAGKNLAKFGLGAGVAAAGAEAGMALGNTETGQKAYDSLFGGLQDKLMELTGMNPQAKAEKDLKEAQERSKDRYQSSNSAIDVVEKAQVKQSESLPFVKESQNKESKESDSKMPGHKMNAQDQDHEKLASAIGKHFEAALIRVNRNKPTQFSNPSRPQGAGAGQ